MKNLKKLFCCFIDFVVTLLNKNYHNNELTNYNFSYIMNKEGELEMSKAKTVNSVVEPTEPDAAELTCFGYCFFKSPKNGTYYTVRVNFDSGLTTAEFTEKEIAGDEKQVAIERLKILLGSKVF